MKADERSEFQRLIGDRPAFSSYFTGSMFELAAWVELLIAHVEMMKLRPSMLDDVRWCEALSELVERRPVRAGVREYVWRFVLLPEVESLCPGFIDELRARDCNRAAGGPRRPGVDAEPAEPLMANQQSSPSPRALDGGEGERS